MKNKKEEDKRKDKNKNNNKQATLLSFSSVLVALYALNP